MPFEIFIEIGVQGLPVCWLLFVLVHIHLWSCVVKLFTFNDVIRKFLQGHSISDGCTIPFEKLYTVNPHYKE